MSSWIRTVESDIPHGTAGYMGAIGTCAGCHQPRQRLEEGLCLPCRQKAERLRGRARPPRRLCDKCRVEHDTMHARSDGRRYDAKRQR